MRPIASLLLVAALAACTTQGVTPAAPGSAAPANAQPDPNAVAANAGGMPAAQDAPPLAEPAPPPPPPIGSIDEPLPLRESLDGILHALLSDALALRETDAPARTVGFEPFYEAGSGSQNRATLQADRLAPALLRERFARLPVAAAEPAALARAPWIVSGGFRLAAPAFDSAGKLRAVEMCTVLIDRASGHAIARRSGWVDTNNLDLVPTAFYLDLPFTWPRPMPLAASELCAGGASAQAQVDPGYLLQLESMGAIAAAIGLYNRGAYAQAATLFSAQADVGGPAALLPLAGLHLSLARQQQAEPAQRALRQWIELALPIGPLGLNFPLAAAAPLGTPESDATRRRRETLRLYARIVGPLRACLTLTAHMGGSSTDPPVREAALKRVDTVRRLLTEEGILRPSQVAVEGVDAGRPLIGLGTDDPRDAWDRRVEMQLRACR
jgi:hypothetical protein